MAFRLSPATAKTVPALGQILPPRACPPLAADSFSEWKSPALGLPPSLAPLSRDHRVLSASRTCTQLFSIQAGTETPLRAYCPSPAIHQTAKNNQISYKGCLFSWAFEAHFAEELEGLFVASSTAQSPLHPRGPTSSVCLGKPGRAPPSQCNQWDAACWS